MLPIKETSDKSLIFHIQAISWCPWQPTLLATGGGTADRQICLWNVSTGSLVHSVDSKSQVDFGFESFVFATFNLPILLKDNVDNNFLIKKIYCKSYVFV